MKYIKGHKRRLYLFNRDTEIFEPVICLTSTDFSQVLEMIEKNNVCEKTEKPRSINRSVSFSGEVATDGGVTIDDLYQEQELSRNSVSKWRLCGGLMGIEFNAYLSDVSDSFGDGDATFSGSLTLSGSPRDVWIFFEDPEVGSMLYSKGLIANPTYSTEEELALIGNDDLGTFIGSSITKFNEFQYFTGITEIESNFFAMSSLSEIIFPSTLQIIGDSAFIGTNLKNVIIPEGVQMIPEQAFFESNLLTIHLPSTITSIGYYAFEDTSLNEMVILATVPPTITAETFPYGVTTTIYVPDASVAAYKAATNWSAYASDIKPLSTKQ